MQKYDDKHNDDGEHHDGEVNGLHVKVEFHDQISAAAASAPSLQGCTKWVVFSSPPSAQSS